MATDVFFTGNLGKIPECRPVPIKNGKRAGETDYVIAFSVCSTRTQRIEGEPGQDATYKTLSTEWRNCELWTRSQSYAEHLTTTLQTGTPLIVQGAEFVRQYKDKDNNNRTDRLVRVNTFGVQMTSRLEGYQLRPAKSGEEDFQDDDIPL